MAGTSATWRPPLMHAVVCAYNRCMGFRGLSAKEKKALEFEVVPREARRVLTRLIRETCHCDEVPIELIRLNNFINIANHVLDEPRYTLKADDWGDFHPAEYAWHNGRREVILQIASTAQLVEILADYLQSEMLNVKSVNTILKTNNCGFTFRDRSYDAIDIAVEIAPVDAIEEADVTDEHPNIRKLVSRMEAALEQNDTAGVLHASASIFETLAKDVVGKQTIQNKTLSSFFDAYRQDSCLPAAILDYILAVYKDRNTEPLAGHGSTQPPSITTSEAVVLAELTKAIIRIERTLQLDVVTAPLKRGGGTVKPAAPPNA